MGSPGYLEVVERIRENSSNRIPVGKCSKCGGVVSQPQMYYSVNRIVPSCESCGAIVDETANLPTLPMK